MEWRLMVSSRVIGLHAGYSSDYRQNVKRHWSKMSWSILPWYRHVDAPSFYGQMPRQFALPETIHLQSGADRPEGLSYNFFHKNDPTRLLYPPFHSWKTGWENNCLDLEIRRNTLFLLHVLKDLSGLLFYILCTVLRRIFLKIFVMIFTARC